MPSLSKDLFFLESNIVFLNHGSFGACPKEVFQVYQDWQLRLEQQPVRFLGREYAHHDLSAREALGAYLHAAPTDLAFAPNATYGVNLVARSLALQPGDEILTTDHEYGACDYTWEMLCRKTGAIYKKHILHLPVTSADDLLNEIWQAVTPRTRLIYLSHITSPTALRLPVESLCARARSAGILTLIDGAHAPGQIPLDLTALQADFYTGNCHKWMMAPKGSAFLYSHPSVQPLVEPLVVSWGFHAEQSTGSQYIDYLQWTGTRDPAAYFTVPAAIRFMTEHDWPAHQESCRALLQQALEGLGEITRLPPIYPPDSDFYAQMGAAPLPECNTTLLKTRLYDEFSIEIPITKIDSRAFIRVSIQAYNTPQDVDQLLNAMKTLLPQVNIS